MDISYLLELVWDYTHPQDRRIHNGVRQIRTARGWVNLRDLSFAELLALLPPHIRAKILNAIREARNEEKRKGPESGPNPSGHPRPRRRP